MLSILTETERAVVATIVMDLDKDQALAFLEAHGHKMSKPTWYRHKAHLNEKKWERLYHIAKIGFQDQHLERISQLELINKLMWKHYDEEPSPFRKTLILEKIANVQPFISKYYDVTKSLMEADKKEDANSGEGRDNNISVSPEQTA
jgi:hypothetical protein